MCTQQEISNDNSVFAIFLKPKKYVQYKNSWKWLVEENVSRNSTSQSNN